MLSPVSAASGEIVDDCTHDPVRKMLPGLLDVTDFECGFYPTIKPRINEMICRLPKGTLVMVLASPVRNGSGRFSVPILVSGMVGWVSALVLTSWEMPDGTIGRPIDELVVGFQST